MRKEILINQVIQERYDQVMIALKEAYSCGFGVLTITVRFPDKMRKMLEKDGFLVISHAPIMDKYTGLPSGEETLIIDTSI